MGKLEKTNKKKSESYPCLLSEVTHKSKRGKNIEKWKISNKKHRKIVCQEHHRSCEWFIRFSNTIDHFINIVQGKRDWGE